MNPVLVIARKEYRDDLRNRWTLATGVLFALLAFAIGRASCRERVSVVV